MGRRPQYQPECAFKKFSPCLLIGLKEHLLQEGEVFLQKHGCFFWGRTSGDCSCPLLSLPVRAAYHLLDGKRVKSKCPRTCALGIQDENGVIEECGKRNPEKVGDEKQGGVPRNL